jgi:dipeptidase E
VLGDRVHTALFIPFASVIASYDEFAANVSESFSKMRYEVLSIHQASDAKRAIAEAEALVVGGGNTFQLLNTLYEKDLLEGIQERVRAGVPYIGWSAGANIACPTIKTTNDMPIVETPSLKALNLVPFQINPHFIDFRIPGDTAETKVERLTEFIAVNPGAYVVAMRDGTMLRVEGTSIQLEGAGRVCVFLKDNPPVDFGPEDSLQFLLDDGGQEPALSDDSPFVAAYAGPNPLPRRFA